MKNLLFIFITGLALISCKKTEIKKPEDLYTIETPIDSSGSLDIHITNMVNATPLSLGTTTYTTANNDTFQVSNLKYYISNIELKTIDGTVYKQKESYYLTDQSIASSLELIVPKVPKANYSSISFLIGVDSVRNFSGAQVGALDPIHGMAWTWSTGYIMALLEGSSPQSTDPLKKISYHIGGFSGLYTGVKKVTLVFPTNATVTKTHTPTLNLKADIALWFSGYYLFDMAVNPTIFEVNKESSRMANNYQNMFQVTSVIN